MATLRDYLQRKQAVLAQRRQAIAAAPGTGLARVQATVSVGDASGARTVRIRDHRLLSDSAAGLGGYDNGPGAPELLAGALGSCLAHSYLLLAAQQGVPLDAVEVTVTAEFDVGVLLAGEQPAPIRNVQYTARVKSPAGAAALAALHRQVDVTCPVLHLVRSPVTVTGTLETAGP